MNRKFLNVTKHKALAVLVKLGRVDRCLVQRSIREQHHDQCVASQPDGDEGVTMHTITYYVIKRYN